MTNIAKILENTPLGIKLYSPICGECTLEEVMPSFISVNDVNNQEWDFYPNGTFDIYSLECLLWPSKEHKDWAGWQSLIMRQDECLGTIVMSGMNTPYIITHDGFVLCENINKCLDFVCAPSIDMRFATIEESEKAMKTLEEENGYYWNEETEELNIIDYVSEKLNNMVDIAKILENAPIGTKLYSPICGECTLDEVDSNRNVAVCDKSESLLPFYSDGTYNDNGECLLWPSKERQTWDGWQEVLLSQSESFGCIFISKQNDKLYLNTKDGLVDVENPDNCPIIGTYSNTIRLLEYADIDTSENGFKKLESNGYHWNYETEELEELNPNFVVGDWVIDNKGHDIRRITKVYEKYNEYWSISVNETEEVSNTIPFMNMNYHKWSIDDAKCGDILVTEANVIFMTNGKIISTYNNARGPMGICSLNEDDYFDVRKYSFRRTNEDTPFTVRLCRPATYEEREKLFEAISKEHYKLCTDNMGNITDVEKIREEPLVVVPTMPEDEIEGELENSSDGAEQFEPTKRIDKHNFETELKELLLKYEIDADTNVPAFILSNYIINNLKVLTLMIDKKTRYEADNWI